MTIFADDGTLLQTLVSLPFMRFGEILFFCIIILQVHAIPTYRVYWLYNDYVSLTGGGFGGTAEGRSL